MPRKKKPTRANVLEALSTERKMNLSAVSKLFTITAPIEGGASDFDEVIEQLRKEDSIKVYRTGEIALVRAVDPNDMSEPEPVEVGGEDTADDGLDGTAQEELGNMPVQEPQDEGQDEGQDEEKRRTASQLEVREYYNKLNAVREAKTMLDSPSGQQLVEYLRHGVEFCNRKVLELEKPGTEYWPVIKKREAYLEVLQYLRGAVDKFTDYAKGFKSDLFGAHVKHVVSIDEDSYIITIDGPDIDELEDMIKAAEADAPAAPEESAEEEKK